MPSFSRYEIPQVLALDTEAAKADASNSQPTLSPGKPVRGGTGE